MEAVSSKPKRPIVVDFLATLFVTFCIGVATSIVLGACVVLMAREVHGAELAPMRPSEAQQGTLLFKSDEASEGAPAEETRERVIELVLTHHLVTKYTSLIAIDRTPARPADLDLKTAALPRTPRAPEERASRRTKFILALAALLLLLGAAQLKT